MSRELKKAYILHILDVLREHSDAEHMLSQKDIVNILRTRYDIDIDRRSVKSAIVTLIDAGYDISYREVTRAGGTEEENTIWTDFYLEKDFTDGELHIMVDSILCSRFLPESYACEIVDKLKRMGSRTLRKLPVDKAYGMCGESGKLLLNAEDIGCAVSTGRQILFMLNEYDDSGSLYPVWDKRRFFSPHRLASVQNVHYVIGVSEGESEYTHFRLDKMTQLEITDRASVPGAYDTTIYLNAHPYMLGGRIITAELAVKEGNLHKLTECFGKGAVKVVGKTGDNYKRVSVYAGHEDLRRWTLLNSDAVFVLSPKDLYCDVRRDVDAALTAHEDSVEKNYNEALYKASISRLAEFYYVPLSGRGEYKKLTKNQAFVFYCNGISDFSFMANCRMTLSLTIIENPVEDLSCLSGLDRLRYLRICKTKLRSLDFLSGLPALASLTVTDCSPEDLSGLYSLRNLLSLTISDNIACRIDMKRLFENNRILKLTIERVTTHGEESFLSA